MKQSKSLSTLVIVATIFLFVQCEQKDNPGKKTGMFEVTIENVSMSYSYLSSGVFNTPVGASSPAPVGPGDAYAFSFHAAPGSKLSFATMYVHSNDLFFAPGSNGIELYSGNTPQEGNVTGQVMLWDAGTEVNEEPGSGANQPPNQSGPNTGPDEGGTVRPIMDVNDGYTYPAVSSTIQVSIESLGGTEFKVTIQNLAGSSTPIAPGVFVVHSGDNPLFTPNMTDAGNGLEALAEDGNAGVLGDYLADMTGLTGILAPGVAVVHNHAINPIFTEDTKDAGHGLEALAEDGDPSVLASFLDGETGVSSVHVFNTPVGAGSPGPLTPGNSYSFSFEAMQGEQLSLASMFVHSNDLFYAFGEDGIDLFAGGDPISGDVTSMIYLWDAGTEVNEYPGAGFYQAPRQSGPDTGMDEEGKVRMVDDSFTYPDKIQVLKVTVSGY